MQGPFLRHKTYTRGNFLQVLYEIDLEDVIFELLFLSKPCQCYPLIETSQLICIANQLTGFYMTATLALHKL